jgi:hypothetical protein
MALSERRSAGVETVQAIQGVGDPQRPLTDRHGAEWEPPVRTVPVRCDRASIRIPRDAGGRRVAAVALRCAEATLAARDGIRDPFDASA